MSSTAIWVRRAERQWMPLLAAVTAVLLIAVSLITVLSPQASATSVGSVDDTPGVYLYNAGSDTQGFVTPPPAQCAGQAQSDPTNETVNIAVTSGTGVLYFIGDEPSEVVNFALGADGERQGGDPDTTTADVNVGLSAIDDYGFVGNSTGNSDDNSNYDAQTGGEVTLRLDIDGTFAAPGGTDLAVIVADGVQTTGVLEDDPTDPFGNLDGNEIFIFEDAETSGMTIELYGPGGSQGGAPYVIDIVDYQRNPDTIGAADDTLIAIDLDTLPGFSFPYVEEIRIVDDGVAVVPNVSSCPLGSLLDTSVELDAVATRTDTVLAGPPAIDIEKATNGEDADTATGPEIAVGGAVNWTYVVTNTGDAPLANVTVADDQGVAVDCGGGSNIVDGPLAPGGTFTCSGSGIAVAGQYTNNSTVVGTPVTPSGVLIPTANVSDADPSNYIGLAPSIDIEKATNGVDSDTAPGETIAIGETVTWTYVVTNDGSTNLVNATVTDDDPTVTVDCGTGNNVIAQLAVGDSATCTATGVAAFGQYSNVSDVVADPADAGFTAIPGAPQVDDTDPSNYTGSAEATIDIEKATNGLDADAAPGPELVAGEAVTWTYVVTNTGTVALTNVTVADDIVAASAISCGGGSNAVAGPVGPGESFTCVASGVVAPGPYVNVADVIGTPADAAGNPIPGLAPPTDTDPSNHVGVVPGLNLEKATNGEDADVITGPVLQIGDVVTWTYTVANTGAATLATVTVTDDDPAVVVDCGTGTNVIATLAVGATVTCSATGVAGLGQYANVATAVGQPLDSTGAPVGAPLTDTDPSHYIASAAPAVAIEKSTNNVDADAAPGPTIPVDDTVTWEYVVINTGDVALVNVTVSDDDASVTVDCGNGTNVVAGPIAPDATFTCTATGVAVAGGYSNLGSVTGTPSDPAGTPIPGLDPVDDSDPSNYTGGDPQIDIEKATNGVDADAAPGPAILTDGQVTWTYVVTNGGNQALTNVTVTDSDPTVTISCTENGAVGAVIPSMAPGDVVNCFANGTAIAGQYQNTATVEGVDPAGIVQTDADDSHYFGADPQIDIEKDTNGEQADAAPGPQLGVGDAVTWTYVVTNTGNTTLINVTVVDDQGVTVDCGGAIPALAPTDTATCTGTGLADAGQYENDAVTTGTPADPAGVPLADPTGVPLAAVTDNDLSHYFGGEPGLLIEKATNGVDADAAPGPIVDVGDPVTWTYVVTNAGNVPLTDVTVTDDLVAAGDISCEGGTNVVATLATGASATCTASGVAVAGQYTNTATAVATDEAGNPVPEVTDPSNYFAAGPAIDIEKDTNGVDSDAAPGEDITVGGAITWTYTVTNTGNVDLGAVTVTDDDPSVAVDCGAGTNLVGAMAPGDVATCTATGTADAGPYTNTGAVTGDPIDPDGNPIPGDPVSDNDPSNYTGVVDPTGTIGDTVWLDLNANGVLDNDETGIEGVTVTLSNASGATIEDVTNSDGLYLFENLAAGTYTVTVDDTTLPDGLSQTFDATSPLDDESTSTIGVAEEDLTQDFGYVPAPSLLLEKQTNDSDADTPAEAVTVQVGSIVTWTYTVTNDGPVAVTDIVVTDNLVDDADIACGAGTTNTIASLAAGDQASCIARGTATAGDYANIGSVDGSGPLDEPVGDTDPSHYEGVDTPVVGSIGDLVWFDANGDGSQQASETGYSDVTLQLIDGSGDVVAETTTNTDGNYLFSNLPAGDYTVQVDKAQGGIPSEALRTFDADGVDTGNSSALTLGAGVNNRTQDFGYNLPPVGSIGDTIWLDLDADGVVDADEVGIADVTVRLTDSEGVLVDEAVTNAEGFYIFGALPAGDYIIVVDQSTLPDGIVQVSDPDGTLDSTSSGTLGEGEDNFDQDFGYQPATASVGDFAFVDANNNGIQDEGETGVAGIVLTLFEAGADGQPTGNALGTDTTDADGAYLIEGVDPSLTYVIVAQLPDGFVLTAQNAGDDDAADSDVNATTGQTDTFTIGAGGANLTLDLGVIEAPASPGIDIEKATAGQDADEAPGPTLSTSGIVTWTYVLTNTGDTALDQIVVVDDREGTITCPASTLAVGAVMTCSASASARLGQYANIGTVTARPVDENGEPLGLPNVTDEDPSYYLGRDVVNATVVPDPTPVPVTATPRPVVVVATVTPTPIPVTPIAVTGRDSSDLAIVALGLVMAGSVLIVAGRRRRDGLDL